MKGLGNILEFLIQCVSTSILNVASLISLPFTGLPFAITCLGFNFKNVYVIQIYIMRYIAFKKEQFY